MESTGVYWIAPHEVLEAAGFEVLLDAIKRPIPSTVSGSNGYIEWDYYAARFDRPKKCACCGPSCETRPIW